MISGVTGVRAVLPDMVLDDATIVVEDGRIAEVGERAPAPPGAIDGRGLFCLPGLVDTHSDGLEKEIWPRPNTDFPVEFALRSFEGRLRTAGVATVFHGVGFDHKPSYDRTVDQALAVCDVVLERRESGGAPVEHRVLYRMEARSEHGWEAMLARLPDSERPIPSSMTPAPLVSFEDHTPGQGQFRDLAKYRRSLALAGDRVPDGMTLDEFVESRLAEAEARLALRETNLAALVALVQAGRIRLLAHDLEDAAQVAAATSWGAVVAEFPLSRDAAAAARERAMPVVLGAPNVLRGGSHSGNVAAEELVRDGLCTALASDYQPMTLLAAVFRLVDRGAASIAAAVRLVTAGPAEVAGLADRGRLEPGLRADLVLVELDGRWPRVRAVARADAAAIAVPA